MPVPVDGDDEFPLEFDVPDDANDDREASSVDVAFEALADRTKFLWVREMSFAAVNRWAKADTTFNQKRGCFSVKEQCWLSVGDDPGTDQLEFSFDGGRSWEDGSGALGAGFAVQDVIVNESGNGLIVAAGTRHVYYMAYTGYGSLLAGTWTDVVNALAASPTEVRCAWCENGASSRFIALYRTGATGFHVEHHADPANSAFTAGTLPAAWGTYTGSNNPEIHAVPGTAIACFQDNTGGGSNIRATRSTNGGSTWGTDQVLATGLGGAPDRISKPTCNLMTSPRRWYIMSSRSSVSKTEVFESDDDGATWASVAVIDAFIGHSIEAVGETLLLVGSLGQIAYSLDRAVTWKLSMGNPQTSSGSYSVRAGGGGFVFWNHVDKFSFASQRIGDYGSEL